MGWTTNVRYAAKFIFVHFRNTCFAAEQDGELVAFLVGFVSQTFPDEAYIHFVGVNPMFRKSGLAEGGESWLWGLAVGGFKLG